MPAKISPTAIPTIAASGPSGPVAGSEAPSRCTGVLPLPAGSTSGALAGGAHGLVLLALLAASRGQRGVDQAGGGHPAARLAGEWQGEGAADHEIEGVGAGGAGPIGGPEEELARAEEPRPPRA